MTLTRAPRGHVAIALIVSDGERPLWEANRYIAVLPTMTSVYLHAKANRVALVESCRDAGVIVQEAEHAPDAVRMAHVAVVFGECPFGARDIEILESQGIPVEHHPANGNKRKGRR